MRGSDFGSSNVSRYWRASQNCLDVFGCPSNPPLVRKRLCIEGREITNGCRSWRLLGQLVESLKDYSSFSNFPLKEGNASSFYLCISFTYKSEDLDILPFGSMTYGLGYFYYMNWSHHTRTILCLMSKPPQTTFHGADSYIRASTVVSPSKGQVYSASKENSAWKSPNCANQPSETQ